MAEEGILWFKRTDEFLLDGTPIYGANKYYTIKMVFGGHFLKNQPHVYTGSRVCWFDYVVPDKLKMSDLKDMVNSLRCDINVEKVALYQKVNDMCFANGLKCLKTDEDVSHIPKYISPVRDEKEVDIYIDMVVDNVMETSKSKKKSVVRTRDNGKCKLVIEEHENDDGNTSDSSTYADDDTLYDSGEDDLDYETYVDPGLEYIGVSAAAKAKGKAKMNVKSSMEWSDGVGKSQKLDDLEYLSDEELDGYESADEEKRPTGKIFDPLIDMEEPNFELLMQFRDIKVFSKAVKRHAIKEGRQISFLFRKREKAKAICKAPCNWSCYVSREQNETQLIVKTLNATHTCSRFFKSKFTDSSWVAEVCLDEWKSDPNKSAQSIKEIIWNKYAMNVSVHQVYRAKEKAFRIINGGVEEQYSKLWDYAEELRRRNPGSTVTMKLTDGSVEQGELRFERFYVCLEGLKRGFKSCRPVLSVDGCFLKGEYGGQLLAASGIDPNNNWYPVAYGVVESESKVNMGVNCWAI